MIHWTLYNIKSHLFTDLLNILGSPKCDKIVFSEWLLLETVGGIALAYHVDAELTLDCDGNFSD